MRNFIQSTLPWGFSLGLALVACTFASSAHAQLLSFDFDGDGVPDEEDLCPLTTDLTGPIPTETLCDGCLSDAETVQGCNATDVLDCKPGPNYHDRKFGVPAKAVDKFVNKLAWAKKCSYDPPPPPPPPETTGNASDVDALELNLPGASFMVPPAALPDGTPITFSYESPSIIEPGLLGPSETVITLVYSLAFSVQQQAAETMTLDIEVPAGITDGIYAFIRVTSDLSNDTPSAAEWLPLPGEYDSSAGRFRVEIGATGELFSIFVVTRTESSSTAATFEKLKTQFAALERWVTGLAGSVSGLFGASKALAGRSIQGDLRERGWVAFCRPEEFRPENEELCKPGSPALQELANTMYDAAVNLDGRGLRGPAALYSEVRLYMEKTKLPFATSDPVGFPVTDEYYVVYMDDPELGLGGLDGVYYNPPGSIGVRASSINNATPIHELFHAVSAADCPASVRKQWIEESHAAAVEAWDASWVGAASNWRFGLIDGDPVWRNWELPLNRPRGGTARYDDLAPYTLGELWLEADPELLFLRNLINDCSLFPPDVPVAEEYTRYDTWLQQSGGPPLADAFVSVIEKRAANDDYPYCGAPLNPNDPGGPRLLVDPVECTTDPCELNETLDLALQRMSAKCYRPLVTLPPSPDCPGEEIFNIEFGGDSAVNRYIVDGTTYEPGDTIQDAPTAFKLWVLDKGIDNPQAFSEGSVVVDQSCPEPQGNVTLIRQTYTTDVSTILGSAYQCASPFAVTKSADVLSYEECGFNDQYCPDGTLRDSRRVSGSNEYDLSCAGEVCDGSPFPCPGFEFYGCAANLDNARVEVIEPIRFGSVVESLTAEIASNQSTPFCETNWPPGIKRASVECDVTTRPSANGTGVVIEGLIDASVIDDVGKGNQPVAVGNYGVRFEVDAPTALVLNYSCDAFAVSFSSDVGIIRSLRHWVNSPFGDYESPDWNCDTISMQLTPDDGYYQFTIQGGTDSVIEPGVQGTEFNVDFSLVIGGDPGEVSATSSAAQ